MQKNKLLIIDDDEDVLLTARLVLSPFFERVRTEKEPYKIRQILEREKFDVILMDMNYATGVTDGQTGLNYLRKITELSPSSSVILMTAFANISLAVEAMKQGANDFIVKPWTNEQLVKMVEKILLPRKEIQAQTQEEHQGIGLIGKSPAMLEIFHQVSKIAPTDANILITGENGTGKDVLAREIHRQSNRSSENFVPVDMGAIPDTLLESELFGHKRGAFTDAREDKTGKITLADKGTLLLDEIGNVSLANQIKLLNALQSRSYTPVGDTQVLKVDIRLISATNADLKRMVDERKFRQDLLYRLNTIEIVIPPLRERKEDILPIANFYLAQYATKYKHQQMEISAGGAEKLLAHTWPGNIRELQHSIERAVIMSEHLELRAGDFHFNSDSAIPAHEPTINLEELEKIAIFNAIRKHQGNLSAAAKELGLGRTTLYRKMEKYGI